jgi:class 3 adenylate cyclase
VSITGGQGPGGGGSEGKCEWARGTPLPTLFCNSQNIQQALDLVDGGGNEGVSGTAVRAPISGPGSAADCQYTQAYTCTYYERVHSFPPGFGYEDCIRNYENVTSRPPKSPAVAGVGAGNSSLCVSWEPPTDTGHNCLNHSSPLVGYSVTLSFNQSDPSAPMDLRAPASAFSQLAVAAQRMVPGGVEGTVFSGLANGVVYLVDVQAIASTGLMSGLGDGFSRAEGAPLADATGCVLGGSGGSVHWQFTAAIVLGVLIGAVTILLGVGVVLRGRYDRFKAARRNQAEKVLLVAALQNISGGLGDEADGKWLFEDVLGRVDAAGFSDRTVAFVFTDIQNSTAMAERDSLAFSEMQVLHDEIVRSHLVTHDGYEVDTEGDAFRIAFPDFRSALRFCFTVQEELMWFPWPTRILQLPGAGLSCSEGSGELLLAGPRVRMGIHIADPREYKAAVHPLTKRIVFTGPGYSRAKAVGDAAWGGQILVSGATLMGSDSRMESAESVGYPVFEDLGLWVNAEKPEKVALRLFQVSPTFWVSSTDKQEDQITAATEGHRSMLSGCVTCLSWSAGASFDALLCRPPRGAGALPPLMWPLRAFPPPRRMERLVAGLGRHWFSRPADLTFIVSVHLNLFYPGHWVESVGAAPVESSGSLWRHSPPLLTAGLEAGSRQGRRRAPLAWRFVLEGTATHLLNMFQGCELEGSPQEGKGGALDGEQFSQFIFRSPSAAVRFALSLQVALLVADWPAAVLDLPACRAERSHDGHLLYRGPRASVGIHMSRSLSLEGSSRHPAEESSTRVLRWGSAGSGAASPKRPSPHSSPQKAPADAGGTSTVAGAAALPGAAGSPRAARRRAPSAGGRHTLKVIAISGRRDLELGAVVCQAAHPGQVIVSEDTWASLNSTGAITVPGSPRVIHLGCHMLKPVLSGNDMTMQLVELTPRRLTARTWPPPRTLAQQTAGCREAPGFRSQGCLPPLLQPPAIAVLFTFLVPPDLAEATQVPGYTGLLDELSCGMKNLLRGHQGYFCQMVDPGCLMASFARVQDALQYAADLQGLLGALRPPAGLPPAADLYTSEARTFRDRKWAREFAARLGPLRVGTGIAFGPPSNVKAHPVTGRADYFGSVVNLAARLASAAHGGQILLEGSPAALLHAETTAGLDFAPLGRFKFRGITKGRGVPVVEVGPRELAFMERRWPDLAENVVAAHGIPLEGSFEAHKSSSFGTDEWVKRSDSGHSPPGKALQQAQSFRM